MKALSLFDGMSCAQIALRELGIVPEVYYASEIDKHAIKQTQLNFPDTVQLGDVWRLRCAMTFSEKMVARVMSSPYISAEHKRRFAFARSIDWSLINLILAGSPCQGFSFAGKGLAFDDPRSKLFFEFVKILNHIRKLNPGVLFLLENVNMKKSHLRVISEYCGVFPVRINSALVSAQNRDRWYWTNIRTRQEGLFGELHSDIPQPVDREILLKDILEDEVDEKYYISQAVINRMARKRYSSPKINPDKTGALNMKNNSGQAGLDSGTTFISVNGKAPTQRCATGRSLDPKHNYQVIRLDMDGQPKANHDKAGCLTVAGHGAGNHSDIDLIMQLPRGKNKGGTHSEKAPTMSANAWEKNNLVIQLNPSKESGGKQPYQQNRVYSPFGKAPALMAQLSTGANAIAEGGVFWTRTPASAALPRQSVPGFKLSRIGISGSVPIPRFTKCVATAGR